MRLATLRTPVTVVLAATLLTGCAQSVDPIERLGKKAAQRVHQHGPAHEQPYRHWGLTAPLAPAPTPSPGPPHARRARGSPVVDHVRTRDRVVFLTYDHDARARRDPRFTDLIRELRLPVTEFRTPPRPTRFTGLPYATQRTEICGHRPGSRLLRPPRARTTRRPAAPPPTAASPPSSSGEPPRPPAPSPTPTATTASPPETSSRSPRPTRRPASSGASRSGA